VPFPNVDGPWVRVSHAAAEVSADLVLVQGFAEELKRLRGN
jgi:hypothetical protein